MSKQTTNLKIGKWISILGVIAIIAGILLVGRGMYINGKTMVSTSKMDENDTPVTIPAEKEGEQAGEKTEDKGSVKVKYVDGKGNEIADSETFSGVIGTEYNFERKEIDGYATNGTEPINRKGFYSTEKTEVVFVYRNLKDTVIINNEEKTVDVQILNDKQNVNYDFEIRTKSKNGDLLSGAGYRITDEDGTVVRDAVSVNEKYLVGSLNINGESTKTFNIEQTVYPNRYKALIENINPISIVAVLNDNAEDGNIYNISFEYESQEGLNVFLDGSTIVVEITNDNRQYSNLIVKYLDDEDNELDETVVTEGEVGTEYIVDNQKEFDGYRFSAVEGESSGVYGVGDTTVIYRYNKIKYGNLIVNYVDEDGNKLATEERTTEEVGTEYTLPQTREFEGYDFVEVEGNVAGTYIEGDITVTYKYKKIKWGNLIVRYIDEENNQIALEEKTTEKVGTEYTLPESKVIEGYDFVGVDGNINGVYTEEDIIVTYKYNRIKIIGKVIVKYEDREGNEIADSEVTSAEVGTEFNLPREGKEIKGYVFVAFEGVLTGKYTEEDITIIYKYEKEKEYGKVIVRYVDEEENVIELDQYTAEIGTEYSFDEIGKEIEGYTFVSFEGALKGVHQKEDIIITYKYNRIKKYGRVILKFVDVQGNEITSDINGNEINPEIITNEIGEKYKLSEIGREIQGYEFKSVKGNLAGTFTEEDIVVTYTYEKLKVYGNIIVRYVDENGAEIALQEKYTQEVGTSYSLPATKEIAGYEFKGVDGVLDGVYTEDDIVITYKYMKVKETGKIIIRYVDENGDEIADPETLSAEVGTAYMLSENGKQIKGYKFESVEGNTTGIYTAEDITITYKYKKEEVIVVEDRNIFIKYQDVDGNEISETEKQTKPEGSIYKFDEVGKTITGYKFKEVKGTLEGTLGKEDITIIYIYTKQDDYVFDLQLIKTIKNVQVINGTSVDEKYIKNPNELVKIEVPAKQVDQTTIRVTYNIEVKNTGNLEGYAKKIVDYIPDNFTYLDENTTKWTVNGNQIETEDLKDTLIKPGESKDLSVTLEWNLKGTDLGERYNVAEITEYENSKDLKINSDKNKDNAGIIVAVSTGAISYTLQLSGAVLILFGVAIAIKKTKKD